MLTSTKEDIEERNKDIKMKILNNKPEKVY